MSSDEAVVQSGGRTTGAGLMNAQATPRSRGPGGSDTYGSSDSPWTSNCASCRADVARDAQRRVRPHAHRIERGTNSARQALVATGAQSQEWVDKTFPPRQ